MVLEGIEKEFEQEDSKLRKIIKRTSIIIMSIFLLILILTYLIPGDVLNILEGKTVSHPLENLSVSLDNGKVIFNQEVYDELLDIYLKEQKTEFKVCLIGDKINNNYHVLSIERPQTISQEVFSVTAKQCSKETLIPLHSHPYKHCIFSEQDIRSYEEFKKLNNQSLMGLMCEQTRFSFYN